MTSACRPAPEPSSTRFLQKTKRLKFGPSVLIPSSRHPMAQAGIVTGQEAGYVVPHEAILSDDSGAPYVVQAVNGAAHTVAVKVLLADGARDVIEGALDPAAPLVLSGNHQLKNGMRVRVAASNQPGGK